jgi:hypothetical protein
MTTIGSAWSRGWRAVRGAWWLVIEDTAVAAGLVGILAWWLSLPVATWWDLLQHLFLPLLSGFLIVFEYRRARRRLAPAGLAWNGRPAVTAAAVWLLAGVALPALLVWWVPLFQSLAGQLTSAIVRFGLAAALLVTISLWWMAVSAREGPCNGSSK